VALDDLLISWQGVAFRHIPADSAFGVLDFRFAGRSDGNRWNGQGEPTAYLASDLGVAIAELGRHFAEERPALAASAAVTRLVYRLRLRIDRLLDVRDVRLQAAISLDDFPVCCLDRAVARSVARYLRQVTDAQALLVPSVTMLDRLDRWNLVLFLEKLPSDVHSYILEAALAGPLQWGSASSE
jgi:RES domain-containing protein